MKLTDERLIAFLKKRNSDIDLERFLNPSEEDFLDAHKLKNMDAAVKKISAAIEEKKHILIYGDYDSDGICSCTILYLFLKSKGANVDVFIPSRFENGYGISIDAIEEIESMYAPDLIITVDLGITAVEEVEILKQEGIDIVVTDHHIPLEEIPDCVVVDPKLCAEQYGFDGLCGAGVALKVVEAIAGRDETKKYLDICAIATVGDIVPLISENRAIAKLGIDKINSGDCLPSISFLMKKLEMEKITSTDISFKIVPRLNACGRMDNAIKVFEFLIEEDKNLLEEKYQEIEKDNDSRLSAIENGKNIIKRCLESYDFNEPAILISGNFHEGIVGILASRIAHEYNRPTIIFTTNEDGNLRGSGRSIDGVDLHNTIAQMGDLLINFGGHKMAIGVEILPENFERFKSELNEKLSAKTKQTDFIINDSKYDILLSSEDLTEGFFNELKLLEPFGCENECPIFAIEQSEISASRMSEKAFKHFRLGLGENQSIAAFNAFDILAVITSKSKKLLIVDLVENIYKNKSSLSVILKKLQVSDLDFSGTSEFDVMVSLKNKYYSIYDGVINENYHTESDIIKVIKQKLSESEYGTIIVASTNDDIQLLKANNIELNYSAEPFANGQNTIFANPFKELDFDKLKSYKNIIFMHKYFDRENAYYSQKLDIYEPEKNAKLPVKISQNRSIFANIYKIFTSMPNLKACNIYDFALRVHEKFESFSASQILFSELVFFELNFFEFDEVSCMIKLLKSKKAELTSSKLYMEVQPYVESW